ncbi:abnormal spindle-like microcephaly-associated protein homolog [Patella vulgata]|uniref:abnormal spindle-like microcephaly-associated protein homolog n=1 Tax=Patella vulgata TaxID=6465 RepID=UPI0024A96BD4|nr:abnormal spindle-like microcephaly-associated protein homolog [Patella vulgata]
MASVDNPDDSLSTSVFSGNGNGTPGQVKKMRRSWFETPPATKLEIAVDRKKRRSSGAARRKSDEEIETLVLTHFTNAPRIGFGTIKVGKAKSRILMVRNPHEYEQEVIVERFPYKKNFSIDQTKFVVGAEDYVTLSITWSPDEACTCREMILFKVDGVYRLQSYVFGSAEAVKKQKPVKKKKGLLGISVKKPFSIINTPGLACIRDNYSPLDAEKPRMSNLKPHPPAPINELLEYQLLDKQGGEDSTPPPLESTAISISSVGYTAKSESVDLGCSPSFSPILKSSEIDGSCVITDSRYSDTQYSVLRDVNNLPAESQRISTDQETILAFKESNGYQKEQDTLQDTPKIQKEKNSRNKIKEKENKNKENSPSKRQRMKLTNDKDGKDKKFLSPETFLNDSLNMAQKKPVKIVGPQIIGEKTVSPTSFLENLNNTKGEEENLKGVPSPSALLQNSIPHNLIVQQLRNVRLSLHEHSFEQKTTVKTPLFQESATKDVRKTNFLRQHQGKKGSDRVNPNVHHQSPRRTTFLVSLKKNRSVQKKDELSKSSKKGSGKATNEEKPKRRKLLTSNKVGQTPISKNSKPTDEKNDIKKNNDIETRIDFKEQASAVTHIELGANYSQSQVHQIFTRTVTKNESAEPEVEKIRKNSGKRLFDANSPKKNNTACPRTITKDKPSPHIHNKVILTGKKLFEENDNVLTPKRVSPFLDEFGSPSVLPSSPSEVFTRRTTLTVTKSRPSDALLYAVQTAVNNNLFECTPTGEGTKLLENGEGIVVEVGVSGSPELPKKEMCSISEKETVEIFTQAPVSPNLIGSPNRLPSSPDPEIGRRSTHLVTSPRFVDLNSVSPRRLFAAIDDIDEIENIQSSKENRQEIMEPNIENETENVSLVVGQDIVTEMKEVLTESSLVTSIKEDSTDILLSEKSESSLSLRSLNDSFLKSKTEDSIELEADSSLKDEDRKKDKRNKKNLSNSALLDVSNKVGNKIISKELKSSENKYMAPNRGTSSAKARHTNCVSSTGKPVPTSNRRSIASSREKLNLIGTANKPTSNDRRKSVHSGPRNLSNEKKQENLVADFTKSTNNRNTPQGRPLIKMGSDDSLITDKSTKAGLARTSSAPLSGNNPPLSSRKGPNLPPTSLKKQRGPMKGVAQSKLMLIKKPKTSVPKHPMPFAARNMYYDERWQEKQERGFCHWLNFILTPPEEYNINVEKTKVDAGKLFVDGMKGSTRLAPTKEVLSIRAYAARRRMNKLRRASCLLYQSQTVVHVIRKVEIEVESRRLAVRKDRMLHADLGIKQKILDMLLCYNPLWLRIGLETIFGEMILLQSNNDVIGLSRFIVYRLLSNPDIVSEYAHPTVPHLYRDGFAEAISSHTLKKFLLLVYFLDHAKQSRLIDHDPCLFCKNADMKASKNFLVQFSRDFLSGEGDITRHLAYLGYVVNHTQTALDEFDYAVTALGVDLRDGLRLTRVMEFLSNDWSLMSRLRAPAISRLQKIHNVEVVFKELTKRGLDVSLLETKLNARDIVDGHKEKTLSLLWHIIFHFQVDVLIDIEQLKSEIAILEKTLRVKISMQKLLKLHVDNQARRDSGEADVLKNERLTLLLKWCRLVCLHYGIKIENFSVSFSDGRALCYLIHHYYPTLLPQDLIKKQTTLSYMEEMETKEEEEFDSDASFDWSQTPHSDLEKPEMFEQFLNNEKDNFKLLYEKVSGLGGIPLMLKAADMSNTIPDEKIVMTYVSHLCSRLLDIREESRAARIIQNAWRRYWLSHTIKHQEKQEKAAQTIQAAYREYRNRKKMKVIIGKVVRLQALWRGCKARRAVVIMKQKIEDEKRIKACLKIKRALETCVIRRKYSSMKLSAVYIQSFYRGHRIRKELHKQKSAASMIQNYYHGYKKMMKDRNNFLQKRSATVTLQRACRNWLKCKKNKQIKAAVMIQKNVRGYQQRISYLKEQGRIVKIQALFRCNKYRTKFLAMKFASISIQRGYRKYRYLCLLHSEQQKLTASCICIQKWWRQKKQERLNHRIAAVTIIQKLVRGYLIRRKLQNRNQSAVKIQSYVKMTQARKNFLKYKAVVVIVQNHMRLYLQNKHSQDELILHTEAATKIQSRWRSILKQRSYNQMKIAAIKIQNVVRQKQASAQYIKKRSAIILIQQRYRAVCKGESARRDYQNVQSATLKLQSHFRALLERKNYQKIKNAVVKIQSIARMNSSRSKYLEIMKTILALQHRVRANQLSRKQRREFLNQKKAAITIQSYYRGRQSRVNQRKINKAIVEIQSFFKMKQARQKYLRYKAAAVILQHHVQLYLQNKHSKQQILLQNKAATKIQSHWRSIQEQKKYNQKKKAAIKIQSFIRQQQASFKYSQKRCAVILLQSRFRALLQGQSARQDYLNVQSATLKLQSCFRALKAKQSYLKIRNAVIKIQSIARMKSIYSMYLEMKKTTLALQSRVRANQIGKKQRAEFLNQKKAVITIQSYFRGHKSRLLQQNLNEAATKIQSHYKAHHQMQQYKEIRQTTISMQRLYRKNVTGRKTRADYLRNKSAVVTIQKYFRGYIDRKDLQKRQKAAIKIQSKFRGYLAIKEYSKYQAAIVYLQDVFRRCLAAKRERKHFLNIRKKTITIQKHLRCYIQKKYYCKVRQAVIFIQKWYRKHKQQKKYHKLKLTTIQLQRLYRNNQIAKLERTNFLQMQKAAICIQTRFRGLKVCQQYLHKRHAVIRIQSLWRGYVQRKQFLKLKAAAVCTQQMYRNKMEVKKCRDMYLKIRSTTVYLQSVFLGKVIRQNYLLKRKAAITIVSSWRSFAARKHFLEKQKACKTIQNYYRNYKQLKTLKEEKLKQEMSATIIQHYWRSYKDCQKKKGEISATKIQAHVKGWLAQKHYNRIRKAVVHIQAHYRGFRSCQKYKKLKIATIIIQRKWRATLLAKKFRRRYLMTCGAVITIQAAFRGFATRKYCALRIKNCIKLQAVVRGWIQREKYLRLKCATLVLQDYYRSNRLCRQIRAKFLQKKMACVKIQNWYRLCKLEKTRKIKNAATIIQSWYKSAKQRQNYCVHRSKVIIVQACVRGFLIRRYLYHMKLSVCVIIKALKTYLFVKKLKRAFTQRHCSALIIQKSFHKLMQRKLVRQHHAVTKIQTLFRGYIQRKCYVKKLTSIILIQRAWRCVYSQRQRHLAAVFIQKYYRCYRQKVAQATLEKRKNYILHLCERVRYHMATIRIQRCYRRHLILNRARQNISSVLFIQRSYRAHRERDQYLKFKTVITKMQNGVRQWLKRRHEAASILQRSVKQWLIKHCLQKQAQSATKIQALWKGYMLRKKTHTKKMAEMRKRINKANDSACEENKLGNRTASALDYLLKYKDMSYILEAVMHLDVVTRLSPRCCERMVEVNAVCVIYRLMRSLNRSLPHMDVIKYSINILLNLAKYDKTRDYVYNVKDSISNLLELLTIYREKGHIFTKTCTLIGILALDSHRRQAIMSNRSFTDKLRSLYALTARKHKLQEGRNLVKAKMNASKSFNRTLPLSTPAKKRKVRPDWLLNRDSIREIDDPMRAIKFVMDNLNLAPK